MGVNNNRSLVAQMAKLSVGNNIGSSDNNNKAEWLGFQSTSFSPTIELSRSLIVVVV